MRLNPFFKVPLLKLKRNSTIRKKFSTNKEPQRMDSKGQETDPMLGMLVGVSQPAIGETRKISPNLTVTVISNSFMESTTEPQRQSSARSPVRGETALREDGDRGKVHEDDDEEECHHEDKPSCASRACDGTAATGTLGTGEMDSLSVLSDLTDQRSWRSTSTYSTQWRQRLACGLPMCGEAPWLLDDPGNVHPDVTNALSVTHEEDEAVSVHSRGEVNEDPTVCFVLD